MRMGCRQYQRPQPRQVQPERQLPPDHAAGPRHCRARDDLDAAHVIGRGGVQEALQRVIRRLGRLAVQIQRARLPPGAHRGSGSRRRGPAPPGATPVTSSPGGVRAWLEVRRHEAARGRSRWQHRGAGLCRVQGWAAAARRPANWLMSCGRMRARPRGHVRSGGGGGAAWRLECRVGRSACPRPVGRPIVAFRRYGKPGGGPMSLTNMQALLRRMAKVRSGRADRHPGRHGPDRPTRRRSRSRSAPSTSPSTSASPMTWH